MRNSLLYIFVIIFIPSLVLAGTKGKIAGIVTDTETGKPLPVANVIVEGTTMGAAADKEGYYVILNVPPGTYTLRASMMGYAKHTVTEVRVSIDRTTTVNFSMQPTVLTGQEVVVIARRPVIQEDVAATQKNITSNQIDALPVASVTGVMGLQPGITSGLSIRGSGSDEAIFMIDGVLLRDQRTNEPITAVPLSAVHEVSVQTGGFSPEYHNVRSGVVNVVTKEGNPDRYGVTFTGRIRPAAPKYFGISPYDPESFWLRPYLDDEVCWTGTDNGAWDIYMRRQYPEFDGWNAVSAQTLTDDDPTNDLTPEACQRIFMWEHRKQGDIKKPDYNVDVGFGGPVPLIGKSLGDLRFYSSFRKVQDMYLMQLSRDALTNQSGMLKLTSDIVPSVKLSVLGLYGETYATTSSGSGGTSYMSSVWDVASQIDRRGFTIPWRIFTNIYWCPTSIYYSTISAKLTHLLNPTTFYELQLKRVARNYNTGPGRYRDTTKEYEIFPGYYVDEAPFGFEEKSVFGIDGLCMGGPVSTSRDSSRFTSTTAKFDLISQINHNNQIKTGLEFTYDQFDMSFGMVNKGLPEGNYWNEYSRNPYRGVAYLQDKIEYEGLISTLGLIAEYIDPNGNWYDVDVYSREFFSSKFEEADEDSFKTKKAKSKLFFSPRIGISHPITANSKLYFNYGHYRQMPMSERLYRVQRSAINQLDYLGDPSLPLARTVSYELGYDHSLFDTYLLHLSAYYKNIDNQEDWTRYISVDGKVNYQQLTANSYEDIRGFEIDVSKMYGEWLTGNVNYEYRVGTSGYFAVKTYYENPADQREYLRLNPYQAKPVPRPRMKANTDFHTPDDFGVQFGNQRPFGGWHFNFVARWTAGYWLTWNPNGIPGIVYNVQWKDYYNLDLKISKLFTFGNVHVKLFADVYNLLNTKYLSGESFHDSDDYNYYMYSLHLPAEIADKLGSPESPYPNISGNDRPGDYRPNDVEYVPVEYMGQIDFENDIGLEGVIYYNAEDTNYWKYSEGQWILEDNGRVDYVLKNRAYIDMPNQSYFTFLNPRSIFFGLTISYHF